MPTQTTKGGVLPTKRVTSTCSTLFGVCQGKKKSGLTSAGAAVVIVQLCASFLLVPLLWAQIACRCNQEVCSSKYVSCAPHTCMFACCVWCDPHISVAFFSRHVWGELCTTCRGLRRSLHVAFRVARPCFPHRTQWWGHRRRRTGEEEEEECKHELDREPSGSCFSEPAHLQQS